jgi:hypothetical protein
MAWGQRVIVGATVGGMLGLLAVTLCLVCTYGIEGAKIGDGRVRFARASQTIGAGVGMLLGAAYAARRGLGPPG